jgi:tetratricopeptide (TPR) repeat protein
LIAIWRANAVRIPRLVEFYNQLPPPREDEDLEQWAASARDALENFGRLVQDQYSEATLGRLLTSHDPTCRRAAVVALGLVGTMAVNGAVASLLQDRDRLVRYLASDALWAIWSRGYSEQYNVELQQLLRQTDVRLKLAGLDALVRRATDFAEAYNQRAILYYRLGKFRKAIADCEKVIRLNPHHFGAAAGMAQCYLKLNKPRAALRSFRVALAINPNLDDVEETIKAIEDVLGD